MNNDKKNEMVENELQPSAPSAAAASEPLYSLNDDRRVKVLSPGMMVAKRFFRNRLAMVGLFILIAMFLFSFVGGLISPYDEDQLFYKSDVLKKNYAHAIKTADFQYATAPGQSFGGGVQGKFLAALDANKTSFSDNNKKYRWIQEGEDFYSIEEMKKNNKVINWTRIGIAYKDVFSASDPEFTVSFDFLFALLKAKTNDETTFTVAGVETAYSLDEDGNVSQGGVEIGYITGYIVSPWDDDVFLTREFKEMIVETIEDEENDRKGEAVVTIESVGEDGETTTLEFFFDKEPSSGLWSIRVEKETKVYDTYASPSKAHWLGTDRYGMDMLTRLMYGGRVSLLIGFVVEIISTVIGVILGGISGFFGGWIDNLIMRIVDIFYCIPSLPIFIIIGAAMDKLGVDPKVRMLYLMLILGFLGWPGIARLVRGQILSLREQEFMTATEACGISVHRRIFKHLVPNVIPQLIVSCTMGLGSTILIEATLSFLGLGVRFPFASWGNIINDVNDTFVLTHYWFIWIPAGTLLLLTVLAFNILGDGLRDAFDPKMKR